MTTDGKKFIGEYVKEISNEDLKLAVKDNMHWRETGLHLYDRTVVDDLYETYYLPIGCKGAEGKFAAIDTVCREVAERVIEGKI